MSKYVMVNEDGGVYQADVYGEDELEQVIDGTLTVINISDPDKLSELDEDGDWYDLAEWIS